jgi:cardiolipin synthase
MLDGPEYYEHYIDLIRKAQKIIHLQTYIFWMDEFGARVHEELIKAAQRKVHVFVLLDSVGSRLFSLEAETKLKEAGVHFQRFNSFQMKWLYSWGRRLHHKILLIDQEAAVVGGINVTYNCHNDPECPQLDFAVCLRGPVIPRLTQYCQMIYKIASREKIHFPHISGHHQHAGDIDVKLLVNDWVYRRWQITKQYTHLAKRAKHEITIINSYFFPRKNFMRQLVAARRRGVRVRLILPKYSDWPSYVLASEYLYAYFLKNGVEIYQWKKSILHGKLATIDNHWSTIGSFNLNYTSYQQNLEMNVNIYSEEFTHNLKHQVNHLIKTGCVKLDPHEFAQSPLKVRMQRFFYYIILSIVANFSIGFIYQEDNSKENRFYNLLRIVGSMFFFVLGLIGMVLPLIPGIPFLVFSFLLAYKQIIMNKRKEAT